MWIIVEGYVQIYFKYKIRYVTILKVIHDYYFIIGIVHKVTHLFSNANILLRSLIKYLF